MSKIRHSIRLLFFSILVFNFLYFYFYQIAPPKMRPGNKLFARVFHSITNYNSGVDLQFFFIVFYEIGSFFNLFFYFLICFRNPVHPVGSHFWRLQPTFSGCQTIDTYSHEIIILSSPPRTKCHRNNNYFPRRC